MTLTNTLDPHPAGGADAEVRARTGDRLELELIGELTSRTMTVVAPDGKLYFNLLPGVDVWGLTLAEAKARLEGSFTNDFVRELPRIAMTLRGVESKRLWVLGSVHTGVYAMATPLTLLDAIAIASST